MEIRAHDHVTRPKGAMQQLLFATFMASANKLVTVDSLTEELWGTTPPQKTHNALQAQISRLRRSLVRVEPDPAALRITTAVSGYQLNVQPGELDAQVFVDTVEEIRVNAWADPHRDIADLRRALALWRGPVFGGIASGPLCRTAASKYEEARTAALELLYKTELRAGGHARIVPELTEMVAQNPLHEQFHRLLMVALYRSGRQIDALNTYRQFQRRLDDDLGIEPSPMLRWYERAILEHDPALMDDTHLSGILVART
jgi:DNA-binding SARP family transcriptional activator